MALYDDGHVIVSAWVSTSKRGYKHIRDNNRDAEAIALRGAVLALHGPGIVVNETVEQFADLCVEHVYSTADKQYTCRVNLEPCNCATDPPSCPRIRGVV